MAVEVVEDEEEAVLDKDYTAEKLGSRTRHDTITQYVASKEGESQ